MVKYAGFQARLFRHRVFAVKTLLLLGILWIMEDMMLRQIVAMGIATGERTIPAAYVFLQTYAGFLMILFLEVLVFYTDVPFITNEQLYVILRSGKIRWYLDQVVYIAVSSLLVVLSAFVLCMLRLLPILKWGTSWDKVLGTLALTDAGRQFEVVLGVPYKILNRYEPMEALLYSLLVGWGVVCFIGMFMFCISLLRSRKTAIILTTVMLLIFGVQNYYPSWVNYLVPLSWMQISEQGVRYSEFAPTQKYVCIMLPVFLCVVFLVGFLSVRKKDFEWMEEE